MKLNWWEVLFYLFFAIGLLSILSVECLLFRCWTNRIDPYVPYYLLYIFPFLLLFNPYSRSSPLQPFHWTFVSDNMLSFQKCLPIFYASFLIASFSLCFSLWMQHISADASPSALGLESRSQHYGRGSPHQPCWSSPNHQTISPIFYTGSPGLAPGPSAVKGIYSSTYSSSESHMCSAAYLTPDPRVSNYSLQTWSPFRVLWTAGSRPGSSSSARVVGSPGPLLCFTSCHSVLYFHGEKFTEVT